MAAKKYVLDSMAFMTGAGLSADLDLYTVQGVQSELKGAKDRERFDYYQNSGLKIMDPGLESLKTVRERSGQTGDDKRLSEVDISILALALELDAVLVTDDYSIQNLADELGVKYIPLGERGIKKVVYWELKCSGCGRIWDKQYKECPVCGKDIRTKRKKTKNISAGK